MNDIIYAKVVPYMGILADWDLNSFFKNAKKYATTAGGAFLSLVGVIAIIWGATLLIKKLMSEQDRTSWGKIIALILFGGALMASGISLIMKIAEGGKTTIEDLGGSTIVPLLDNIGLALPALL